jgi:hypothetical protein
MSTVRSPGEERSDDMRNLTLASASGVFFLLVGCEAQVGHNERSVAAGARPCEGRYFFQVGDPTSCCMDDEGDWYLAVRPGLEGTLVHRQYGGACSNTDGTTGCGEECFFGPCGASVPVLLRPLAEPAHVFYPRSNPTVCGRHADSMNGGVPEDWDSNAPQEPYPGVHPTCPWTTCGANGPAVQLTVEAQATGATGHVKSIPAGIDLTGGGEGSSYFYQLDVKLSAKPVGRRARAVFSGACNATGDYGKDIGCKLTLGPDKTVTVSYECQPGFTCRL